MHLENWKVNFKHLNTFDKFVLHEKNTNLDLNFSQIVNF